MEKQYKPSQQSKPSQPYQPSQQSKPSQQVDTNIINQLLITQHSNIDMINNCKSIVTILNKLCDTMTNELNAHLTMVTRLGEYNEIYNNIVKNCFPNI